jgi:molybdopterin synthase catalytic subunit
VSVCIQAAPFDVGSELQRLHASDRRVGAIASFIGLARDINDGLHVSALTLEHYPGMTERALERIIVEARSRWDILDARIVHRVGTLAPLDPIVLVAVASMHRHEAFDACRFIMDYLKTEAPFWKKEVTAQGARWVGARAGDEAARDAWKRGDVVDEP